MSGAPRSALDTYKPPPIPINYSELPPLLSIDDQQLLKRSLSHQSYLFHGDSLQVGPDYGLEHEKASWKSLEFRGDAVLSHYLCEVITRRWPDASATAMDSIRRLFLSNQVFASLAKHYGFQQRILISPHDSMQGLLNNQSVLADSFEAYVGALDVEAWRTSRHAQVFEWLACVFSDRVFPTFLKVGLDKEEHLIQKRVGVKLRRDQKREKKFEQSRESKASKRPATDVDNNLPRPDTSKRQRSDGGMALSPRKKGTSNLPEEVIAADGNPAHASSSTNKPPSVLK